MASPVELTAAVKTHLRRLGGAFMKSRQASDGAAAMGLGGFGYYFGGRGGVLGAVDADVVAAAFGFFPVGFVREQWALARAVADPPEYVLHYAHTCHAWGRDRLGDFPGAARLGDLLQRVADAASVVAAPLFAGWRRVPVPDDPPARVAHLSHLLREHRGSAHLTAVLAGGLAPLEAILTRDGGAGRARFLHWPEPYPPVTTALLRRRARVEKATDRLAAPAYAVLDAAEAGELRALLATAYDTGFPECTG